jgi:hypothetical protein
VLQGQELMELVAISPEDDAMRTVSASNSTSTATTNSWEQPWAHMLLLLRCSAGPAGVPAAGPGGR